MTERDKQKITVVLLPGADGTGLLFTPLLNHIKQACAHSVTGYDIDVINLNHNEAGQPLEQSVTAQARRIERLYNEQPVIIIAESYSGLIANELLARGNLSIKQVIFVASFLGNPNRLTALASRFEAKRLKYLISTLPEQLWGRVVFGQWYSSELICLFKQALEQTPDKLLQQRLQNIANASHSRNARSTNLKLDPPCLYLQATADRLVGKNNIKTFKKQFTNFDCVTLEGTHFLLQTNPAKAWSVIESWLSDS